MKMSICPNLVKIGQNLGNLHEDVRVSYCWQRLT